MKLRVIDSGSDGNAYILYNDTCALLIECGVPFATIKRELGHDLSKVVGCLVTHEHKDHSKSVNDVLAAGIPVFASVGTHEAMGTMYHHNAFPVELINHFTDEPMKYQVGDFIFLSFRVQHDAKEPVGFLIKHPECGVVLFATDTYYLRQKFHGLNQVIIEANYCESILQQRTHASLEHERLSDRIIASHMSIQQCLQTLEAHDLSEVNNVVLIHLSNRNSHARSFKQQAEQRTGKTVTIAEAGVELSFNKHPF